jgi:isoleucyl-tRNA synthetase
LSVDGFDQLIELRDQVNRQLEPMRDSGVIGSSLQAEVALFVDEKNFKALLGVSEELKYFFITSALNLRPIAEKPADAVQLTLGLFNGDAWMKGGRTVHNKCIRCWHYVADVGANPEHPEICLRCVENVDGAGEVRRYF